MTTSDFDGVTYSMYDLSAPGGSPPLNRQELMVSRKVGHVSCQDMIGDTSILSRGQFGAIGGADGKATLDASTCQSNIHWILSSCFLSPAEPFPPMLGAPVQLQHIY